MELMRIGSAFGAAMETSWQNARLRAAEKRISRMLSKWHRAMRAECARPCWRERIDASIDPVIACAACVMLAWLVNKWM
jgi:hypothetical protein